jgi:hypothetical protein
MFSRLHRHGPAPDSDDDHPSAVHPFGVETVCSLSSADPAENGKDVPRQQALFHPALLPPREMASSTNDRIRRCVGPSDEVYPRQAQS